jgi:UDP-N-acetylglucosamine 1-carboxyvinyltransferase
LANLLEMMGAQIHGIGSNVLRVFGIGQLHGADVNIGPDHIETASVAALAAMSGGRIQLQATRRADLRTIAKSLDYLGVQLDMDATAVFVPRHETLVISNRQEDVDASIKAAPWPGFPSDLIGIATVVATQARGTSLIHEPMYDNRLLFVDKLNAMGAQIVLCDPHRAIVVGESPLHPIYMDSPDVRTGLGMLAAALVAHGETVIDNAEAFQVNFDGVIDKLQRLGAQIVVEAE